MSTRFDLIPFPDVQSGQFHCYVYSKTEKTLVYVGLYLDKQAAMQSVRRSVSSLGLRCLFHWDTDGNYRCGNDPKHIYGQIRLQRVDMFPELVKSNEHLPFDELE